MHTSKPSTLRLCRKLTRTDMGFQKIWWGSDVTPATLGATKATTFVLGNLNFYLDANPLQDWRFLTEAASPRIPTAIP